MLELKTKEMMLAIQQKKMRVLKQIATITPVDEAEIDAEMKSFPTDYRAGDYNIGGISFAGPIETKQSSIEKSFVETKTSFIGTPDTSDTAKTAASLARMEFARKLADASDMFERYVKPGKKKGKPGKKTKAQLAAANAKKAVANKKKKATTAFQKKKLRELRGRTEAAREGSEEPDDTAVDPDDIETSSEDENDVYLIGAEDICVWVKGSASYVDSAPVIAPDIAGRYLFFRNEPQVRDDPYVQLFEVIKVYVPEKLVIEKSSGAPVKMNAAIRQLGTTGYKTPPEIDIFLKLAVYNPLLDEVGQWVEVTGTPT